MLLQGRAASCCAFNATHSAAWTHATRRTAPLIVSLAQRPRRQVGARSQLLPGTQWKAERRLGWVVRSEIHLKVLEFQSQVDAATLTGTGRRRGGPPRGVPLASLFGVGAPEALVIGVVALIVFGPKGLAEVARNLGKTLRTFQPTIRELQEVSREFRSTLEQEIGLDELQPYRGGPNPPSYPPPNQPKSMLPQPGPGESADPRAVPGALPSAVADTDQSQASAATDANTGASIKGAYTAEDYARVTEEQARALVPEELRRAAEAAAWGGSPPPKLAEAAPSSSLKVSSTNGSTNPSSSRSPEAVKASETGNGTP